MSATISIQLLLKGLLDAPADIGSVSHDLQWQPGFNWSDGSGADQLKQFFTDTRTLAASANEDLDLAGSLVNALGQTLTFTKIRGLIVRASPANSNNVVVGGAAANQFATPFGGAAHQLVVRPGGLIALFAPDATGYAVTASTGDLLRLANSGGGTPVTYDIVLLGTTA